MDTLAAKQSWKKSTPLSAAAAREVQCPSYQFINQRNQPPILFCIERKTISSRHVKVSIDWWFFSLKSHCRTRWIHWSQKFQSWSPVPDSNVTASLRFCSLSTAYSLAGYSWSSVPQLIKKRGAVLDRWSQSDGSNHFLILWTALKGQRFLPNKLGFCSCSKESMLSASANAPDKDATAANWSGFQPKFYCPIAPIETCCKVFLVFASVEETVHDKFVVILRR